MHLTSLPDKTMLTLPDDLLWSDEHVWTPATAAVSYLLTGALLIETATRQRGRPITLVSGSDMGWVQRQTIDQLYAWAAQPSRRLLLTLRDRRQFNVGFRHHETAMEAEPVQGFVTGHPGDYYRLTLRLMEL